MTHLSAILDNRKHQIGAAVVVLLLLFGIIAIVIALTQQKTPLDSLSYSDSSVPAAISPDSSHAADKHANSPVLGSSQPVSLKIPAIHSNDPLTKLGKNKDGSVQVPSGKHIDEPGWYKYSPTPGAYGASVILGHVDDIKGPSAFWELENLKSGEKIEVKRADGVTAVFTIDKVKLYRKDAFPTQEVYTSDNTAALRLVTCGGFNKSTGKYDGNTVVFATLTSSHH